MQRKGTERDGNWGYPPFAQELVEIKTDLAIEPTIMKTAEGRAGVPIPERDDAVVYDEKGQAIGIRGERGPSCPGAVGTRSDPNEPPPPADERGTSEL